MRGQTVVVCVALLALCCVLIPRGGESAGGLLALQQPEGERREGALPGDESQDDPETERGLAVERDTPGSAGKVKRDTEEAAVAGECSFFFG